MEDCDYFATNRREGKANKDFLSLSCYLIQLLPSLEFTFCWFLQLRLGSASTKEQGDPQIVMGRRYSFSEFTLPLNQSSKNRRNEKTQIEAEIFLSESI
jgi:hypothetical protein